MRRRDFIAALGGVAAQGALPPVARAQQSAMPVVGFLASGSQTSWERFAAACREGLRENDYIDGRNVSIEYRWAENFFERLPNLASELVLRQAAVIVASGGNVAPLAAQSVTKTIPIVFAIGSDPVRLKLVDSLNKPGGNITGVSFLINALGAKRLELLGELLPTANVIGALVNPRNPNAESDTRDLLAAAASLGREVHVVHVTAEPEFEAAFATLLHKKTQALIISPDVLFTGHRDRLVALAAQHSLPAIYHLRELAVAGGLMSYGTSITEAHRQAGVYAGRILRGEKPADLPVIQSTKFELVINLKTAKTLGLEIPTKLLALADEVIE